ncbi:NUDIX domain-containing protein [Bacillus sp. BGMRC 2118]|nr:NUDIX domain-containing protein [Bacillus sp. BGMRC 2118]
METALGKVTCFITRRKNEQLQLLLLEHPSAGIQLPAGTVEVNEEYERAALREATEETGLKEFLSCKMIGVQEQNLEDKYVLLDKAKVYSRPDISSFQWAEIRRGITVLHEREHGEFVQISYKEGDQYPDPNYISYQITGWVKKIHVTTKITRKFYHLHSHSKEDNWEIHTDNHTFKLFWSKVDNLPSLVSPQTEWLAILNSSMTIE